MATTEDPRARSDSTAEWKRELYDATPERTGELFSTISGLENEPLYTPDNVDVDYDRDLGYPGVYPFTRGVYPSMYRGKLWTMRQFAGFGTAEETNARFRYLLEHGQTGLSTAFDMPTPLENEPLYTPDNVDVDYDRDLGYPGVYPFTRGVYPSMYRGKLWTMRQFAGFGTAEETNARFRYLLEHGQTGLSTAFDMPTLMGY